MQKDPAAEFTLLTRRALIGLFCVAGLFLALLALAFYPGGTALAAAREQNPRPFQPRALSLTDRIEFQRGIEGVYRRHRIWPTGSGSANLKPVFDQMMSRGQLERKVRDYLRNSQLLEEYWQQPVRPEQLQAEMERMAQQTKQPDVLRELFGTLGNDPFVIAECLARPALSERLARNLYGRDQRIHGELKRRAEADLRAHPAIRQMKETSGVYSEIAWIKSDDNQAKDHHDAEMGVKISRRQWARLVQRLGARIGDIETGLVGPLEEDEWRYYATAVIEKTADRLTVATIEWRKEAFESWRARTADETLKVMAASAADYALPTILKTVNGLAWSSRKAGGTRSFPTVPLSCPDDTWTATSETNAPTARYYHTAVWTGSEAIVWGGWDSNFNGLNTGGRYSPAQDSWTPTSTAGPTGRAFHTAVWADGEMIVWGGYDQSASDPDTNTGASYNPGTDSWTAISTINAPAGRQSATAVWTGNEMIVWGGYSNSAGFFDTGGRYNPSIDNWTATSTVHSPSARFSHTAVWTGSEMIVWGGSRGNPDTSLNTGGRYNPDTDSWTATSTTNAPTARFSHSAVWADVDMIIWGGDSSDALNTGGRYNPVADSWTTTSIKNAPSDRFSHTAVWTSNEMIVSGGQGSSGVNAGGRYNPGTDGWTTTSTISSPTDREYHTAVWTGTQMIVWGGQDENSSFPVNTGGRYCAQPPGPTPTPTAVPTSTPTPPPTISLSGKISYCSNYVPSPVATVILTVTGSASKSAVSDSNGNFSFPGLASGGSYTVTPSKPDQLPGARGINTLDVIAVQRHFLKIAPLTGCRLMAADADGDSSVNISDALAIRQFYFQQPSGKVGEYLFFPENRVYSALKNNQVDQDFDALIVGDVISPFADHWASPLRSAAGDGASGTGK